MCRAAGSSRHRHDGAPVRRAGPEGDLIGGKDQGSATGTLVERQARVARLLHMPYRDSDTLHDALRARMADLPRMLLRSIIRDQGTEMARHLTITRSLGVRSTSATRTLPGIAARTRT